MNKTTNAEERISRITSQLAAHRVEGTLFFDMKNIRYLTGFTGSDGVLFIGEKGSILLVDGRYVTQAKQEVTDCDIFEYRDKVDGLAMLISDHNMRVIGFESSALTCDIYLKLTNRLNDVTLEPLSEEITSLRAIKDIQEIDYMRKAATIASQALQFIMTDIQPGISERAIALILESKMKELGGETLAFETIVASGSNSALPHAKPGSRKIENGDFVVVDYGIVYQGYHSDETCTVAVGSVTQKQRETYQIVKDAHDRALDAVKEGVSCREIDRLAREHIEKAGLEQYFSHGTGHGVGLEIHETPIISSKSDDYLTSGMIITIEPGVYIPDLWGIRVEDMVVVERDGCEILSTVPKHLQITY
jgi:Xaa-Pro aminopeptidase